MSRKITPELLITSDQRADLGVTDDFYPKLRLVFDRLVTIAGRVCVIPANDDDLPPGVKMGDHAASAWKNIGIDRRARAEIKGRLHLGRSSVADMPYTTVSAEGKLVLESRRLESVARELGRFSGYDDPDDMSVMATLGTGQRISINHAPYLLPVAEDLLDRFAPTSPIQPPPPTEF